MDDQYYLMLDDVRSPKDVDTYIKLRPIFSSYPWIVVKKYADFVSYIEEYGIPEIVALDHDLSLEHYTPPEYWNDYEASKKWQVENEKNHTAPTGLGAVKWLIEYCKKHEWEPFPKYIMITMNPIGRDNMGNAIHDYTKERYMHKKALTEDSIEDL